MDIHIEAWAFIALILPVVGATYWAYAFQRDERVNGSGGCLNFNGIGGAVLFLILSCISVGIVAGHYLGR